MTHPLASPQRPPTAWQLFLGFGTLGLIGFGGVLPFARRLLVDEKRWLSSEDFADLLGLCNFLPGGNIINISVALGLRFAGLMGAVAAFSGLVLPPLAIVLLLGATYERYHDDPLLQHGFSGLAAVSAGLLFATTWRLVAPFHRRWQAVLIAFGVAIASAAFRWPMLIVVVGAMIISMALHRKGVQ